MRPATRPEQPAFLAEHGAGWSREYAAARAANPSYRFDWKRYQGERVNRRLLPALREMTQKHCAYCDGFPLDTVATETIDHFLPKSRFPESAYDWANLYLACPFCQGQKEHRFDRQIERAEDAQPLLRPDEPDYTFERYFIYNHRDGTIDANPGASEADRSRAESTIYWLGFNEGGRPQTRKRQLRIFRGQSNLDELDDWPYRFLLEAAAETAANAPNHLE